MKTLVLLLALSVSGCATVGGQVLKNCELGQLSNAEKEVASCAIGALAGDGDWKNAVLTCGEALIPAQLNCVIAAIVAAAEGGGFKSSIVAIRGRQWLSDHSVRMPSCY